jgi:hypothetical protein
MTLLYRMPKLLEDKVVTTKPTLRFPKLADISPDGKSNTVARGGAGHKVPALSIVSDAPIKKGGRKTKADISKELKMEKNERIKSFIASEPKKSDMRDYIIKRLKELSDA